MLTPLVGKEIVVPDLSAYMPSAALTELLQVLLLDMDIIDL